MQECWDQGRAKVAMTWCADLGFIPATSCTCMSQSMVEGHRDACALYHAPCTMRSVPCAKAAACPSFIPCQQRSSFSLSVEWPWLKQSWTRSCHSCSAASSSPHSHLTKLMWLCTKELHDAEECQVDAFDPESKQQCRPSPASHPHAHTLMPTHLLNSSVARRTASAGLVAFT